MPSYTTVSRPSVPTYGSIPQADYTIDFLFQDSVDYFFQDGNQKVFDGGDSNYTDTSKPSVPTYASINKPS